MAEARGEGCGRSWTLRSSSGEGGGSRRDRASEMPDKQSSVPVPHTGRVAAIITAGTPGRRPSWYMGPVVLATRPLETAGTRRTGPGHTRVPAAVPTVSSGDPGDGPAATRGCRRAVRATRGQGRLNGYSAVGERSESSVSGPAVAAWSGGRTPGGDPVGRLSHWPWRGRCSGLRDGGPAVNVVGTVLVHEATDDSFVDASPPRRVGRRGTRRDVLRPLLSAPVRERYESYMDGRSEHRGSAPRRGRSTRKPRKVYWASLGRPVLPRSSSTGSARRTVAPRRRSSDRGRV